MMNSLDERRCYGPGDTPAASVHSGATTVCFGFSAAILVAISLAIFAGARARAEGFPTFGKESLSDHLLVQSSKHVHLVEATPLVSSSSEVSVKHHDARQARWAEDDAEQVCDLSNVVVAIKSGASDRMYQARRMSWRQSQCAKIYEANGVNYRFLLGLPIHQMLDPKSHNQGAHDSLEEIEDLTSLKEEQATFGDIEFLPVRDIYDDFYVKTFQILQWANRQANGEIVVLHDDEYCVNLDELKSMCHSAKAAEANLYGGYYLWKDETASYSPYFSGWGYVLSKPLVNGIVSSNALLMGSYLSRAEDLRVGYWVDLQIQKESHNLGPVFYAEHGSLLLEAQPMPSGDLVSCGGHKATKCEHCPQGHGESWCHGDCTWKMTMCVQSSKLTNPASSKKRHLGVGPTTTGPTTTGPTTTGPTTNGPTTTGPTTSGPTTTGPTTTGPTATGPTTTGPTTTGPTTTPLTTPGPTTTGPTTTGPTTTGPSPTTTKSKKSKKGKKSAKDPSQTDPPTTTTTGPVITIKGAKKSDLIIRKHFLRRALVKEVKLSSSEERYFHDVASGTTDDAMLQDATDVVIATSSDHRVIKHHEIELISCGNHKASECEECEQGHGETWCHGDCQWNSVTSTCTPLKLVSCGSHKTSTCEKCPQGHGESWCHGDCIWNHEVALCEPLPKLTHSAYDDIIGLSPFQPVRDENGQFVNIILVRSMFFNHEHETLYEKYKNDILFLGIMSYEAFPFPSPNPWSVQFPQNKYLDLFPGWLNMYRDSSNMFPSSVKVLQLSQSDFGLPEIDYKEEVSLGQHLKRFDFAYVMSGLDTTTSQCDSWGAFAKNWTFVRDHALDVLCGELDMTGVLLVTRDESGKACKIPPSCEGKILQTPFVPYEQVLDYLRQSRFLFLPQVYDASPRIATQALTMNVPLLMNRNIVGGWKYINEGTGEFFHDMSDFQHSVKRLMANLGDYEPRKHVLENYGDENAGMKLRKFVEENFGDRVELPDVSKLLVPVFN